MLCTLSAPTPTIVAIVSAHGEAEASIVDVVATVAPATITVSEASAVATTTEATTTEATTTEATKAVDASETITTTTMLIGSSRGSTKEKRGRISTMM